MTKTMAVVVAILVSACAGEEREPITCAELATEIERRADELGCVKYEELRFGYEFACTLFGKTDMTQEQSELCLDAVAAIDECPADPFYPPADCFW